MKIGVLMVVHCDAENVNYALKGIYDFADVIVVVHSDTSWSGVKKSDGTLEILHNFMDPKNKLRIFTGSYPIQRDHRQFALNRVKEEGCNFLFVVDGDEIYSPDTLRGTRKVVEDNPQANCFGMRFHQMWKTLKYRLDPDRYFSVLWKISDDLCFARNARRLSCARKSVQVNLPEPICYHLTAVCSDEFMKEKMITRGYKNQVVKGWLEDVWLKWHPEMENLHPTKPSVYKKAVSIDTTKIPDFMKTHKYYE